MAVVIQLLLLLLLLLLLPLVATTAVLIFTQRSPLLPSPPPAPVAPTAATAARLLMPFRQMYPPTRARQRPTYTHGALWTHHRRPRNDLSNSRRNGRRNGRPWLERGGGRRGVVYVMRCMEGIQCMYAMRSTYGMRWLGCWLDASAVRRRRP